MDVASFLSTIGDKVFIIKILIQ